jgi:hypothetical protein
VASPHMSLQDVLALRRLAVAELRVRLRRSMGERFA